MVIIDAFSQVARLAKFPATLEKFCAVSILPHTSPFVFKSIGSYINYDDFAIIYNRIQIYFFNFAAITTSATDWSQISHKLYTLTTYSHLGQRYGSKYKTSEINENKKRSL